MTGEELKVWRKANGWTQAGLMEELEITSRQTITTWEKADRIPRVVELAITAIDQIEVCRKQAGLKQQFTIQEIASRHHSLWKQTQKASMKVNQS